MHIQRAVTSAERTKQAPAGSTNLQGDNSDGLPALLTSKAGRPFHFSLFLTALSLRPDQCGQS